jgi:haloalkane dehalogenase
MNSIAAKLLPYESAEFAVGPHQLRYLDVGVGDRVILCVHGNPTWSFYWRRVIERFSPRLRVVAVDHLGCGRSDKPPRTQFPYTLAAHRDNLMSLIDHLDLRNVMLLAHDWGGAIGLSALLQRRDRFNAIALLNTGAFPPPYVPWRIAACRTPILGSLAVRGLNGFAKAAVTMAMSKQKLSSDAAAGLLAPYNSWRNRVAIDAFVRDIPLSARHPTHKTLADLQSALPSLANLPSCLIWGMQDWCFRPECLQLFQAAWPHAQTVQIADAGHYVIEDAPQETLAAIDQFVSSLEHA